MRPAAAGAGLLTVACLVGLVRDRAARACGDSYGTWPRCRGVPINAQYVDAVVASGQDVVIADALVPFVPTLLAMGHDEETIDAFMTDLTEVLARVRPLMVFLDGNAESALSRAVAREGAQWLDWYIGKLDRYEVTPPVSDVASAVKYLLRERAVTLGAARRKGWGLVVIERADELSPDEVLRVARRGLRPWLGTTDTTRGSDLTWARP